MTDQTLELSDFPLHAIEKIRYGDTDRQGHVNNAVYATYFEAGRVEIIEILRDIVDEDAAFVLATITIDYISEVLWPGEVELYTRISRVGNSSIGLEQVLMNDGELRAKASSVLVMTSLKTRSSTPLSDQAKERLQKYM